MGFFSSLVQTVGNVASNLATGNIVGAVGSAVSGLGQATGVIRGTGASNSASTANTGQTGTTVVTGGGRGTTSGGTRNVTTTVPSTASGYTGQSITGNQWVDSVIVGAGTGLANQALGTTQGQTIAQQVSNQVAGNWMSRNWFLVVGGVVAAMYFIMRGKR